MVDQEEAAASIRLLSPFIAANKHLDRFNPWFQLDSWWLFLAHICKTDLKSRVKLTTAALRIDERQRLARPTSEWQTIKAAEEKPGADGGIPSGDRNTSPSEITRINLIGAVTCSAWPAPSHRHVPSRGGPATPGLLWCYWSVQSRNKTHSPRHKSHLPDTDMMHGTARSFGPLKAY